MSPNRPWYKTPDGLIDPFKFRQHQMGILPAPDTWHGFLMRLSSYDICEIDRLLFAAKVAR